MRELKANRARIGGKGGVGAEGGERIGKYCMNRGKRERHRQDSGGKKREREMKGGKRE